ncbi:MAG: hypothetical protein AAF630_13375 [Cyanobacteria bacterium P01_C01_bin.38]
MSSELIFSVSYSPMPNPPCPMPNAQLPTTNYQLCQTYYRYHLKM